MPLPTARVIHAGDVLRAEDIYPDSTWITFKYNVAPLASFATFARVLKANGFAQPNRKRPLGRRFNNPEFGRPVYVGATFNVASRTASFTAQFSPLADLRDENLDYGDEVSRPYRSRSRGIGVAENWLHPDQVTEHTSGQVLNRLWERICILEPQIQEIASLLVTEGPFTGYAPLLATKLSAVELCADLATTSPHYHLRRLAPRFREQFNEIVAVRYGPTARGYTELSHGANLIRGYRSVGQCMKAYEKTNRRLRYEFGATGTGLRSLCAVTAVERGIILATTGYQCPDDPREFRGEEQFLALFDRLVRRALPEFNAIRGNEPEPGDHGSIFEFMSRSASVLRRHTSAQLELAYRALILEGRLTSQTLVLPALLRLQHAGVLRRSAPGIYVAADRFRRALQALRVSDGRWQRLMHGAAE